MGLPESSTFLDSGLRRNDGHIGSSIGVMPAKAGIQKYDEK